MLSFLCDPTFEPLLSRPLQVMTRKVLFLISLAGTKQVRELQTVSFRVAFQGDDLSLSYLPEFLLKTESERNPIPQSFFGSFFGPVCWGPTRQTFIVPCVSDSHLSGAYVLYFAASSFAVCLAKASLSFIVQECLIILSASGHRKRLCSLGGYHSSYP